jgi:hypothetical protein
VTSKTWHRYRLVLITWRDRATHSFAFIEGGKELNVKIPVVIFMLGFIISTLASAGEISDYTYNNKYVGLRFPLPVRWYVATDAEVFQGIEKGSQIVGFDSQKAKAMIARMRGKVLIWVLEHPLDSGFDGLDRNMIVAAIDWRDYKSQIPTGADYLRMVSQSLKKSYPNVVVSEVSAQRLGGEDFSTVDTRSPEQGIMIYQRMMAGILNDYLLVITMSADSPTGLEELSQIAKKLGFSPVPKAVDTSTEGQLFRKQTTIHPSGR